MKQEIYIQHQGNEVNIENLIKNFKELWKSENKKIKDINKLQLYYNVDERTCYFVVNDMDTGSL